MDPEANIKEQRELAQQLVEGSGSAGELDLAAVRLGELVLALDEWRRNGGYDPYAAATD